MAPLTETVTSHLPRDIFPERILYLLEAFLRLLSLSSAGFLCLCALDVFHGLQLLPLRFEILHGCLAVSLN